MLNQNSSHWRCFPVGLRPPFKHLQCESPDNCITKQNVKEQIYSNLIFMPYGTKIGASGLRLKTYGGFQPAVIWPHSQ